LALKIVVARWREAARKNVSPRKATIEKNMYIHRHTNASMDRFVVLIQ
jgi:uncharacterized MAPEG superfamily protein